MDIISPGKARCSWDQEKFFIHTYDGKGEIYTWLDFLQIWEERREQFVQINTILAQTNLVRRLEYDRGIYYLYNGLQYPQDYLASRWLKFSVACQMRQGRLDQAFQDFCGLINAVRMIGKRPDLFSQDAYIDHCINNCMASVERPNATYA